MMTEEQRPKNEHGVEVHLAHHGKVAYLEVPAADPARSAAFYDSVFGWIVASTTPHVSSSARPTRVAFQDATRDLIGAFVTALHPAAAGGVLPYLYVEGIDQALTTIREHGGEVVENVRAEGGLWVATFRDPGGNIVGVWQAGDR
jgi:predicted enzyme related to lactoylglutathione lyase